MVEPRVRLDRLLPVFVAAAAAGVALWASRTYAVGVFHDDGVYVILGKSIATGQGYRFLHLPGAPAATHYPPLYPILLALLWKIAPSFPENVPTFLFANAMLLGITALGVHTFAHSVLHWSRRASAVAALVATLSTPLLMLSSLVLSEPLFAALLFPTLIAAERSARDESSTRATIVVSIGLGLLALVRTHAIALTIALLLVLALRRRWRTALVCAIATAATLAPWQLWLALHAETIGGSLSGSYGTYGAWLASGARGGGAAFVLQTVLLNLREVGALLADHFALADTAGLRNAATATAILVLCVGAWRAAKRAPVLVAFTVVYLSILLVWPFTPWRFVFAVWPVVVLLAGEAIAFAAEVRHAETRAIPQRAAAHIAIALCAAIICLGGAREEVRAYGRRAWAQPGADATAQIAPLVRWVLARTNAGDVLAVDGEQLVFLFTGRKAVPVAPFTAAEYLHPRSAEQNAESLRLLIQEVPITYVATISPNLRSSGELLAAAPGTPGAARLVRLAPLAGGEVFRVERTDRAAP
jgi:hypothetical protein